MKTRVLIVEDDAVLRRLLQDNLALDGFEVASVANGDVALSVAKEFAPNLVLLDLNLPGKSGFELCAAWRRGTRLPIIILTARAQKSDKLRGLKLGADDYVTKPFDFEELQARIRAVLRRTHGDDVQQLVIGGLTVDFVAMRAFTLAGDVELTHQDFQLLRYLAERPGMVVHRDELLREVWGYSDATVTRAVDHAVARLRKKIEANPHRPRFLHTVHGDGYYLTPDGKPVR